MNGRPTRPTLGRCPLLYLFLGAVAGNLAAEFSLWPILILFVVLGIYQGLYHRSPPLTASAVTALLMASWHNTRLQERKNLYSLLNTNREVQLSGTLVESNSAGLVRRLFRTEAGAHLTLVNLPDHFKTGQNLLIIGRAVQQEEARNPKGWNPEKTLSRRGIAGCLQVTAAQANGWSGGFPLLRGWAEDWRHRLSKKLTTGIPNRSANDLVKGVILGEKTSSSNAFDDFRKTGTMHVFAVSGLHVGLVALIIFGLGRLLRLPPRLLLWTIILAMFGYAFVTGLRPPALRASLMSSLFLGRFLLHRRPSTFNNLFAAGLIVLISDSFQLWRTGFQLSFFVVAVIFLLEPHLWKRLAPRLDHDPFLPKPVWTRWQRLTHWSRNKVGKMFTVSSAAWLGSAPLSALHFGWFTPIAAFASVWMVMFAFLILIIAFISLVLGSIAPSTGPKLNSLNGHLATTAKISAETMASWPGAWARLTSDPPWGNGLCVFDLNYGGGAVHLNAGGGVLIDAGNETSFWQEVQPALTAYQLSCDSLIATHNDAEHIGGLDAAVRIYPIQQALIPRELPRRGLAELVSTSKSYGVELHLANRKTNLTIDDETWIEVLSTGNPQMPRADDRGLVLLVHQLDWRILITADSGYETERALLANNQNISADIWICGRHSMDNMGHDAFIRAVNPKAIIATEKSYPESEQIPKSWQKWLESEGVAFFSQKEHGAVFVNPRKNTLTIKSYLQKGETVLTR